MCSQTTLENVPRCSGHRYCRECAQEIVLRGECPICKMRIHRARVDPFALAAYEERRDNILMQRTSLDAVQERRDLLNEVRYLSQVLAERPLSRTVEATTNTPKTTPTVPSSSMRSAGEGERSPTKRIESRARRLDHEEAARGPSFAAPHSCPKPAPIEINVLENLWSVSTALLKVFSIQDLGAYIIVISGTMAILMVLASDTIKTVLCFLLIGLLASVSFQFGRYLEATERKATLTRPP